MEMSDMNQQGKTETLVCAALPDETVGNVFVDNPRITARDVNVFYGDKQAIDRVTLDIAEKQVISFIGPSGCGKSTFLRCLNRMNDTIDICRIEGEISAVHIRFHTLKPKSRALSLNMRQPHQRSVMINCSI